MRVTQMPSGGGKKNYGLPYASTPVTVPDKGASAPDIRKILSRFEKDDYILAGLIIVLVLEGCDDYILLAALGYLFIMGLKEQQ